MKGNAQLNGIIKLRAKELGITETEVAKRAGWLKQGLAARKNGQIGWTDHTILRLARVLELDPDELFAVVEIVPPDLAKKISSSIINIKVARAALGMAPTT